MSQNTTIEWTDVTWNPIRGCSMAPGSEAEGCLNCYAARQAARNLPAFRSPTTGKPFAIFRDSGPRWTGDIERIDSKLEEPLHWKKPRKIFVNSMNDLFHEKIEFSVIGGIWSVMERCPQHFFQVLTKRPKRMQEFMQWVNESRNPRHLNSDLFPSQHWPVRNIWLGVSVEDQKTADDRIPFLLETPASVRWISAEPLLGPITGIGTRDFGAIRWVVCGGESGPGARPMHPHWAKSLRDQCKAANVPFFFKQWGEWRPVANKEQFSLPVSKVHKFEDSTILLKDGKKKAGRSLDGHEWNQFPYQVGR